MDIAKWMIEWLVLIRAFIPIQPSFALSQPGARRGHENPHAFRLLAAPTWATVAILRSRVAQGWWSPPPVPDVKAREEWNIGHSEWWSGA